MGDENAQPVGVAHGLTLTPLGLQTGNTSKIDDDFAHATQPALLRWVEDTWYVRSV